jgi:hypothetical protein
MCHMRRRIHVSYEEEDTHLHHLAIAFLCQEVTFARAPVMYVCMYVCVCMYIHVTSSRIRPHAVNAS